jgi:hypothetical protein
VQRTVKNWRVQHVDDDKVIGKAEFAPIGISSRADEVRALVKSGVVTGVSCGFDILESQPHDKNKGPRGGLRITKSRLLEVSFVAVPADAYAGVIARHVPCTAADLAMIAALPKTPAAALQRAAASFSSGRGGQADRQNDANLFAAEGQRGEPRARLSQPSGRVAAASASRPPTFELRHCAPDASLACARRRGRSVVPAGRSRRSYSGRSAPRASDRTGVAGRRARRVRGRVRPRGRRRPRTGRVAPSEAGAGRLSVVTQEIRRADPDGAVSLSAWRPFTY